MTPRRIIAAIIVVVVFLVGQQILMDRLDPARGTLLAIVLLAPACMALDEIRT